MLPLCIEAGLSSDSFFESTMKIVHMTLDAYYERKKIELKNIEFSSWLTGYYVMQAIGANFSKNVKYPENPLNEKPVVNENMVLTEEEKEKYRKSFIDNLQARMNKFNKTKRKSNGK